MAEQLLDRPQVRASSTCGVPKACEGVRVDVGRKPFGTAIG